MKDGVVPADDTPQNLYDHPCNQFVADPSVADELADAAVGSAEGYRNSRRFHNRKFRIQGQSPFRANGKTVSMGILVLKMYMMMKSISAINPERCYQAPITCL